MKNLIYIALSIFVSHAFGSPKLTYMVESADGQKQIAVSDADGENSSLLTQGKRWHLYPRFSADGSQIAYSEGDDGSHLGIYILNLKTHGLEHWVADVGQNLHAKFSGNGRWLAYSGPLGENHIPQIGIIDLAENRKSGPRVVKSSGGQKIETYNATPQILTSQYPCFFPAFSSDGSFVVYQRDIASGIRDIVLQDLKSKALTPISDPHGNSMSPALSFDDRYVAFTSKVNKNWDIYIFDRFTHSTTRVTSNVSQDFAPTFKPDGTLVFASDREGHFQLYTARAPYSGGDDSKYVKPLVTGSDSYYAPSFSGEAKIVQGLLPAMVSPARSSFGSVRVGDRVYVVGGHQGPEHTYPASSFTNRVEYYDLKDQEWYPGAPRQYSAHGFGVAAYGKYIYAFGGFAFSESNNPKWTSLDVIERLDTEKNVWTVVGKMPHRRSSNVVAQVGSLVYLIGGWDSTPKTPGDYDGTFQSSIDVFDMQTEKIVTSSLTLPKPLRRAFTGVVRGKEIILIGGIGEGASHFELLNTVTALNTETGTWEELPPLPFGTFAPAAGVLGKNIFVFGGMLKEGDDFSYINHIYALPRKSHSWINTGRYLSESKGFSQVVPVSSRVLAILGGHQENGDDGPDGPVTSVETFGF